jgi:hypothetical protein
MSTGIKAQYRDRRDLMVDLLVGTTNAGLEARQSDSVYEIHTSTSIIERDEKGFPLMSNDNENKKILSFVAPQGGMFSEFTVDPYSFLRKLTSVSSMPQSSLASNSFLSTSSIQETFTLLPLAITLDRSSRTFSPRRSRINVFWSFIPT